METEVKNCCSNCGKNFEMATPVDGHGKAEKGAISICFKCGQIGVFQEDLTVRKITEEELQEIQEKCPEAYLQMIRISAIMESKIVHPQKIYYGKKIQN